MTPRPPHQDAPEGEAPSSRKPLAWPTGMSRTQQMGTRGLAAASIGWTFAGCILLGAGAGMWLDKKFGTAYWTPILFLVGVVAAFREMLRTVSQLNAAPPNTEASASAKATSLPPRSSASTSRGTEARGDGPAPQVLERHTGSRLFSVPPPPFMEQPADTGGAPQSFTPDEIKRRLLGEDDELDTGKERGHAV